MLLLPHVQFFITMPTIYKWEYTGGEDGSAEAARRGTQRAFANDYVVDDIFGCAHTIRTVHLIAKRQLSLNDMHSLLELQLANDLTISYDHAGAGGNVEDGGLAAWLLSGARVFEFRELLGTSGRNAHRGTAPPKYEYTVKVEVDE